MPGQKNILFNKKTFALKLLHGTLLSLMIFFIPYGIYQDMIAPNGLVASNIDDFAVAAGAILVVVVNLQVSSCIVFLTQIASNILESGKQFVGL